jgi:hypothetical protein
MKHKLPLNFRYLAMAMFGMMMGLTKAQPYYQPQADPSSALQAEPAGTDSCGNPNDGGTPPLVEDVKTPVLVRSLLLMRAEVARVVEVPVRGEARLAQAGRFPKAAVLRKDR